MPAVLWVCTQHQPCHGPRAYLCQKRIALPTVDHPLSHADFEAVIPEAEYGAGTVPVCERSPVRNLVAEKDEPKTIAESITVGHVDMWIDGKKLRAGYVSTRILFRRLGQKA